MQLFSILEAAVAITVLAQASVAKTVVVRVGSGGNKFNPDRVQADVGDVVEFQFAGGKHSVVQGGSFGSCSTISGGFNSGVQSSPQKYSITVTSTEPIYYFCDKGSHCRGGMVGQIN